ncbi:unnamed protein product [Onchocerca flexuosa]|uniref:Uncharacterized protein n=1 Tax=Onchocerca flexuosa TaxID=387005 RepID=A0A183I3V7_9BILA|nr:unnamed protein product [Onchocerca flexuosa]
MDGKGLTNEPSSSNDRIKIIMALSEWTIFLE